MRKRALLVFSIFFILATLTTITSAGKEIQLTFGERLTTKTSIYDNHVFWTDTYGYAVSAYDITTGKRIPCNSHGDGGAINSFGNNVVWTGDSDSVHMCDISNGDDIQIASGSLPDIYGNYVVYTYANGIFLYNLRTHDETKIANVYSSPAIYDTKVVWSQANGNNGYDISEYDISTNQTKTITTIKSSIFESELDIYGNVVVWGESGNIYMYDIESNKKTQVTNNGYAREPAIYGNRIVYTMGDPFVNGADIYMYEISTAKTTRITTSTRAFSPSIYGDKIVYADSRNDLEHDEVSDDIYLYNLNPENEKLKAIFIAYITSGDAPLNVSFNDNSQGTPKTWYWDFGDGTNSTEQSPMHTYSEAGNFTVNLTISDGNYTDSESYTINLHPSVYAYITNYGSNNISVIDTITNSVIATVNVGFNPLGVTVNPSGTKVYVANEDGTVSVIDTSTNTVTDSVPVGHLPYGIAINPAGTRVYVVNLGDNTVSVIDTATNNVTATVSVGDNPIGVAVTPDGTNVYVTNHDSNSVSVIDAATNTVTGTVNVGQWPIGVAVNPAGKKVYVANVYSNSVSVIDIATNTVTATINVGENPVAVAISPDGKKVYVTNSSPISILDTVSVIDTATNNVTTKVSVGNGPYGVAVTPDGTKVYAANEDGTVSVIDIATNSVTDTVPVGQWPIAFGQFLASVPSKPVLPVTNFSTNVKRIITEADNGKSIGLKSGEIFYLILDNNPSTGFSWELNLSNGLMVLNYESIPNSLPSLMQGPLSGWGYSDIRTIKADSVGTQQIKGVYKQHWNGGMEIPYCINLTVDTSNPGKAAACYGGRSTGGGGSASSEPATNVKIKEISQVFITSGSLAKFDFPKNDTSVMYVCFNSKKTVGKTTANVEMLKGKSVFVSEDPADEVYNYLNIWIGNSGFATPKNIENSVVFFKVDKSWVQDKNIDRSSITLNRYNDKIWNQLPTNLSNEDDNFLYFTSQTPGFSPFAITGKSKATGAIQHAVDKTQNNTSSGSTEANILKTPEQKANKSSSEQRSTKTPGFEVFCGMLSLLVVLMYKRR